MSSRDKAKEERLAVALRENLRRRKAQARELSQELSGPEAEKEANGRE